MLLQTRFNVYKALNENERGLDHFHDWFNQWLLIELTAE